MSEEVELLPVEYDAQGRPRRYEVVRVADQQHIEYVDMGPSQLPEAATRGTVRTTTHIEGSYQDRAKGFSITTMNLALVTGVGLVMAAIVLGDGLGFVALSAWFFAGFCTVWLASFILHTFISPEGIEMFHTWRMWNYLDREQTERHRYYRPAQPDQNVGPSRGIRMLLATAILFTVTAGGLLLLTAIGVIR